MGRKTFARGAHRLQTIRQRFVQEFQGRYEITASGLDHRDFVVKKDAFSGVYIGVEEDRDNDTITVHYERNAPHFLLRGPLARLLGDVEVLRDVEALLDAIAETPPDRPKPA